MQTIYVHLSNKSGINIKVRASQMDTNLGLGCGVNALLIGAYSSLFPVYNKQTALHTGTRRVVANNKSGIQR